MNTDGQKQPGPPTLRAAAVLAMAAALAAGATMAGGVITASDLAPGSVRTWLIGAATGFGLRAELGLVAAALLLLIDHLTGPGFRGQRLAFGTMALVAAIGMVVNVAAGIDLLTLPWHPSGGTATLIEGRVAQVAIYLAPALIAGFAAWVALNGARTVPFAIEEVHHAPT